MKHMIIIIVIQQSLKQHVGLSGEMRKELAHYIKRKYTKGSREEITAKRKRNN
jgi:hypothetical protein